MRESEDDIVKNPGNIFYRHHDRLMRSSLKGGIDLKRKRIRSETKKTTVVRKIKDDNGADDS